MYRGTKAIISLDPRYRGVCQLVVSIVDHHRPETYGQRSSRQTASTTIVIFFSLVYQRRDWFQKITRSRVILDSKVACPFRGGRIAQLRIRPISIVSRGSLSFLHRPPPACHVRFPMDIVGFPDRRASASRRVFLFSFLHFFLFFFFFSQRASLDLTMPIPLVQPIGNRFSSGRFLRLGLLLKTRKGYIQITVTVEGTGKKLPGTHVAVNNSRLARTSRSRSTRDKIFPVRRLDASNSPCSPSRAS